MDGVHAVQRTGALTSVQVQSDYELNSKLYDVYLYVI